MNTHRENRLDWVSEVTGIPRRHIETMAQMVEQENQKQAQPSDLPASYDRLSPRAKFAFHRMRQMMQGSKPKGES